MKLCSFLISELQFMYYRLGYFVVSDGFGPKGSTHIMYNDLDFYYLLAGFSYLLMDLTIIFFMI